MLRIFFIIFYSNKKNYQNNVVLHLFYAGLIETTRSQCDRSRRVCHRAYDNSGSDQQGFFPEIQIKNRY